MQEMIEKLKHSQRVLSNVLVLLQDVTVEAGSDRERAQKEGLEFLMHVRINCSKELESLTADSTEEVSNA